MQPKIKKPRSIPRRDVLISHKSDTVKEIFVTPKAPNDTTPNLKAEIKTSKNGGLFIGFELED